MLADAVGIAQVVTETSHVFVFCTDAHMMFMDFIDVLRAIDPCATYNRTITRGYPTVLVMNESGAHCHVMFAQVDEGTRMYAGIKNAHALYDHHFNSKREMLKWAKFYEEASIINRMARRNGLY